MAKSKPAGLTLIESILTFTLGTILMMAAAFLIVMIATSHNNATVRINGSLEWLAADAHLKKHVHGSAYAAIQGAGPGNQVLTLYNSAGNQTGNYSTATGAMVYTDVANTANNQNFNNLNPTFTAIDIVSNKIREISAAYIRPFANTVYLICGCTPPAGTWARTYGWSVGGVYPCYVQQVADYGYIIAGMTLANRPFLIKTDAQGVQQWGRIYNTGVSTYAQYVYQTTDGYYVVVGQANSLTDRSNYPWNSDIYAMKVSADGNSVIWIKRYSGGQDNFVNCIDKKAVSNDFILTGYIWNRGIDWGNYYTPLLLKINSNGDFVWAAKFHPPNLGLNSYAQLYSCREDAAGNYVALGVHIASAGSMTPFFVKIDSAGNLLAQIKYFYHPQGASICLDGAGYAIGGFDAGAVLIRAAANGIPSPSTSTSYQSITANPDKIANLRSLRPAGNGFIIGGGDYPSGNGLIIAAVGGNNSPLWSRIYRVSGAGNITGLMSSGYTSQYDSLVSQTNGGNYIVGGTLTTGGKAYPLLIKTDSTGACPESANPVHDNGSFTTVAVAWPAAGALFTMYDYSASEPTNQYLSTSSQTINPQPG